LQATQIIDHGLGIYDASMNLCTSGLPLRTSTLVAQLYRPPLP